LDIKVALLLSIARTETLAAAIETVEIAKDFMFKGVVGIDFSGNPTIDTSNQFIPALTKAREYGLKLALHYAESTNYVESKEILKIKPDRLGHGCCLNEELFKATLAEKIPLEICLSSNIKGKVISHYDVHPFVDYYKQKYPLALCTDDKGIFLTTLTKEYTIARDTLSLSHKDLFDLSYSAIDYIFQDNNVKETLRKKKHVVF